MTFSLEDGNLPGVMPSDGIMHTPDDSTPTGITSGDGLNPGPTAIISWNSVKCRTNHTHARTHTHTHWPYNNK